MLYGATVIDPVPFEPETHLPELISDQPSLRPAGLVGNFYFVISLFGLLVLLLLSFTGRIFWWADWLAYIRPHLCVLLVPFIPVLIWGGAWLRFGLVCSTIALSITTIVTSIPDRGPFAYDASQPPLRILTLNVTTSNQAQTMIAGWLQKQNADVIMLIEANRKWMPMLDSMVAHYPYIKLSDDAGNYGMALLSRYPLGKSDISRVGPRSLPTLQVEIETPLGLITFVGIHPNLPTNSTSRQERDLYLAHVSAMVRATQTPVVLMGTFYATPWSSAFAPIRELYQLQPATLNMPASWPASMGRLGLTFDQILLSTRPERGRKLGMTSIQTGRSIPGTEHLPVIAEIREK